jgi:tRNA threonylcarbamoyladenosine modification (KEOPS) complex  Pcc1 subunit
VEAEIIIEYDDANIAEAIAAAVSPENNDVPSGLHIKTGSESGKVFTKIKCQSFKTFVATIDDLLFSISIAEKTLRETKKR